MSGEVTGPRCLLSAGGHLRQVGLDALHAAAVPDRGQGPGLRVRAGGRERNLRPGVQHCQPRPRLPGNAEPDRRQFKDKNSIIFFLIFTPTTYLQYCGPSAPATEGRVPAYTDNLNSWLGQILQRDAPHIPVEIVDVETTGYVLRLCPFEDVAMVGLSADDVESFLQVGQFASCF